MWKYGFILFKQISSLDLLLNKIAQNLPSLHYLSLLGNAACPNQLSDPDKDEEDYQRYRYWLLLLDLFYIILCFILSEICYSWTLLVMLLPCKIPTEGCWYSSQGSSHSGTLCLLFHMCAQNLTLCCLQLKWYSNNNVTNLFTLQTSHICKLTY